MREEEEGPREVRTRYRWDRELQKLVEVTGEAPSRYAHNVISDEHVPFKSMADGKIYDSKSAYRRSLKERGLEEAGNERSAFTSATPKYERPMSEYVDTVKRAARELGMDVL